MAKSKLYVLLVQMQDGRFATRGFRTPKSMMDVYASMREAVFLNSKIGLGLAAHSDYFLIRPPIDQPDSERLKLLDRAFKSVGAKAARKYKMPEIKEVFDDEEG